MLQAVVFAIRDEEVASRAPRDTDTKNFYCEKCL